MALHKIDAREAAEHFRDGSCPCGPVRVEGHATIRIGKLSSPYRGVIYTHRRMPAPAPAERPERRRRPAAVPPEAGCGCTVVYVVGGGGVEHHVIPVDEAQHAPTTKCGCGPRLDETGTHAVFVHVDQGFSEEIEQLYREVFQCR